MTDTFDPRHPHERDGRALAPVLDAEGRCYICGRDVAEERLAIADRTIAELIVTRDELERDNVRLAIALRGLADRIEDNGQYLVGGLSVVRHELALAREALRNEA